MASIESKIQQSLQWLHLNRPDVFNSLQQGNGTIAQQHLDEAENNPSVRAIVITGNGKAFWRWTGFEGGYHPRIESRFPKILEEHYNPIIQRIRSIEKAIVAAVNGVAAGAGANIALACDVVMASETASFIQAFSKIGLIPDSGGTFFLPRLIGFQKHRP